MRYPSILVLLIAGLVHGCTMDSSTTAPPGENNSAVVSLKRPIPFKANLRGGSPPPAPSAECGGLLLTEIAGGGISAHLGRFTALQRHCLNPTTFTFNNGVLTYTGANGDELEGTYSGSLAPTPDPMIVEINGQFAFNGGTGRFANAEGNGAATGRLDVTNGNFILFLDGTISY